MVRLGTHVIVEEGISEMPAVVSITTSATSRHPVRLVPRASTPRTHSTAGSRTTPSFAPPQCPPLLRGSNASTDHSPVAVNGTDCKCVCPSESWTRQNTRVRSSPLGRRKVNAMREVPDGIFSVTL